LQELLAGDPESSGRLLGAGIRDAAQLLEAGRTPAGRAALAEASGVPLQALLGMVHLADLTRISDIKGVRVWLLVAAGCDTVEKLARADPETLHTALAQANQQTNVVRRPPSLDAVTYWIWQACELEPRVQV
jgi:hypothetical protein